MKFNSITRTIDFVTVEYEFVPGDPDVGLYDDYDVFVFDENGKDITYDIAKSEYTKLMDEARDHHLQQIIEHNLDMALSRLEEL
jgi:hypothetical protein